ncbi:MAG: lactate utilization protein [Lachnospiraceae bacterium]|nr:lactate utilization protein [Lachnospiraceae bacterium]
MHPMTERNSLLAKRVVENLKKRHFDAFYCETAEDAMKKALELIPEGSLVSWGGSMTLKDMGLIRALNEGNYETIDRDNAKDTEEMWDMFRRAFSADWYLSSANAISEDGVIYNIDRTGNRVAAIAFGPKNVLIIAGANKIAGTEAAALERARKVAAPANVVRLRYFDDTPCLKTGTCINCKSEHTLCSKIVALRMNDFPGRIKVIITAEEMGF